MEWDQCWSHSNYPDQWELWSIKSDGTILAILHKENGLWAGRIPPNVKDHLPPQESLQKAMMKAEEFVRKREGVR